MDARTERAMRELSKALADCLTDYLQAESPDERLRGFELDAIVKLQAALDDAGKTLRGPAPTDCMGGADYVIPFTQEEREAWEEQEREANCFDYDNWKQSPC